MHHALQNSTIDFEPIDGTISAANAAQTNAAGRRRDAETRTTAPLVPVYHCGEVHGVGDATTFTSVALWGRYMA